MITVKINNHKFEADLKRVMRKVEGEGRAAILKAGGMAVADMATESFRDASLRPAEWEPLKPATLKKKKAGRVSLLIDTGAMFRSIKVKAPKGDTVEVVVSGGANVNSDRKYATFHQFGTKKMVARPFIPATGGADGGEANLIPEAEKRVRRAMEAQTKAVLGENQ